MCAIANPAAVGTNLAIGESPSVKKCGSILSRINSKSKAIIIYQYYRIRKKSKFDDKVKSFKFQARKFRGMRRTYCTLQ